MPRQHQGAVIHDPQAVVQRAVRMVRERTVETIDGAVMPLLVDTICVHGDTPGAANLVSLIRAALVEAGIEVKALRAA